MLGILVDSETQKHFVDVPKYDSIFNEYDNNKLSSNII
jgi:hypothetical protein